MKARRSVALAFVLALALLALFALTSSIAFDQPAQAKGPSHANRIYHTRRWYAQQNVRLPVAGNLVYFGGPVMHTLRAYTIFWAPAGHPIDSGYQTLLNRYLSDIGGSSFYNIVTQYYDNPGPVQIQNVSTLGGTFIDTTSYPHAGTASDPLQDSDIRASAARAIAQNNWPTGTSNMFFVFTPQGVESCLDSTDCTPGTAHPSYCAYHGDFVYSGNQVIYANMPYDETWTTQCRSFTTSPNGNIAADSEISTSSHEHFEAATDPLLNAWFDLSGYEIGDKCAYNYGSISSDGHNVVLNGNKYIAQQEWSNAGSGCALSYGAIGLTATPSITPTSTATRTATNTPTMTNTPANTNTPTTGPSPTPTNTRTPTATATATNVPSATPTRTNTPLPTPTATSSGANVVLNPGFESGPGMGWTQYSSGGYQVISTNKPHTGKYSAWECGFNNCTEYVQQKITVPTNATLKYWRYMASSEGTGTAYDYMYVRLYTTGGSLITTLRTWSNRNTRNTWTLDSIALSGYAGQTVVLRFMTHTDYSLPTSFWVDDVSVQ